MGTKSQIQWTDATWNIAVGCTKVDSDCKYCYMYRDSLNGTRYNPKEIRKTKTVFNLPLRLKEPSKIFSCSLTDFFHEECDSFRNEAWEIISKCPQHTFQILTKRPERILQHLPENWKEGWKNVWLGTSIGSMESFGRVKSLIEVPAKVRFLSIEPLHDEVNFRWEYIPEKWRQTHGSVHHLEILKHINWVIVGGESGNDNGKYRYRPCKLEWIEQIVDQCQAVSVKVFVKQLGTYLAKQRGMSDRHGGNIDDFPAHLRLRQFPIK